MNCKMVLFVAALVLLFVQSAFAQADELSDTVWTKFTYPVEIRAVKFTPDGRYLVTGGSDAIPKLWDVETGELVKAFPGRPTGIWTISMANNMLAFFGPGENGIQIYDLNSYELIKSLQGSQSGEFTSDGKYLVTGRNSGISVIDVQTWEEVKRIGLTKYTNTLSISPDNKFVARSGDWGEVNYDENFEGNISIYTLPDLHYVTTLEKKEYLYCPDLAFSPDGKYLAGALYASPNKVWNTSDWKLFRNLGQSGDSRAIVFSPDSRYVVTGISTSGKYFHYIFIFDIQSGEEKYNYVLNYFSNKFGSEFGDVASSISISPDAKKIIVGGGIGLYMLNAKWNPTSVSENPVQITEPLIFPNPANRTVNIRFNLIKPSQVSIEIFDISSIKVAGIYEGFLESGLQNFEWNILRIASGTYFARITAQGAISTVKIIVEK